MSKHRILISKEPCANGTYRIYTHSQCFKPISVQVCTELSRKHKQRPFHMCVWRLCRDCVNV